MAVLHRDRRGRSAAGATQLAAAGSAGLVGDLVPGPADAMGSPRPLHGRDEPRSTGRLIWSEHAGATLRLAAPCVEGAAAMGPAPHEQQSRRSTRFRPRGRMTMAVGAGVAALALIAAGCSSSSPSSTSSSTSGAKVKGGTAVWAEPPSTVPNYIFPFTSSAYISVINTEHLPVPDVPAAVLVRHRGPADAEPVAEPGQPADLVGEHRDDQAQALQVVQRHAGDLGRRHVLGQHAQGRRAPPTGAPTRVPGLVRVLHQGGQPHRDPDDHEQGLLAQLVPVQRPVPDHPDAGGLGQDRLRVPATARPWSRTAPRSTTT